MFPRGLDPEFIRSMQERAAVFQDIAQRNWPMYESAMQKLVQSGALQREAGHYAALQQMLQNISPISPEVMQAWQATTEMLNSPGFVERLARARQVGEIAAQRFGADGLAAAQQLAWQRLAAGPGLEQAAERIQNGHAAELLSEAASLAASPEVRETIEKTDKDEILRLAEEWRNQEAGPIAGEPDIEAGAQSEVLEDYITKEELLELIDAVLELVNVIGAALAAMTIGPALAATDITLNPPPNVATLMAAHTGLVCLLLISKNRVASWDDEDK